MAFSRSNSIQNLYRLGQLQEHFYSLRSSRSYSNAIVRGPEVNCNSMPSFICKDHNSLLTHGKVLRSEMAAELSVFISRSVTTHAKAPPQARQMGAMQVSMLSPGFIYEPYAPREPISFLKRWFTRSGWQRTKADIILELKNAYAVAKLRKTGYSKQMFYKEAFVLYKEINKLLAHGEKTLLRKSVTENMYSALKNDIKQRESMWSKVYWELIEPAVKIRTLRARLIGVDRSDLNKVFIQLTLEFLTKQGDWLRDSCFCQKKLGLVISSFDPLGCSCEDSYFSILEKFEAYDTKGTVVAGDKNKEVLVRDIWVFEKSLFHPGAYWRLCGRIPL